VTPTRKELILKFAELVRPHSIQTNYTDGKADENKRLLPLITVMADRIEELEGALTEAIEHTSSNLEDMEHYFENKCCPTVDEVNQVSVADSHLRLALQKPTALDAMLKGAE
jgi:hypothetical protein